MRAVVTRVKNASVVIDGEVHGQIGTGFLVLLGVHENDTEAEAKKIADKLCGLRVFEDANGKMNVNPMDAGAAFLIISQFTLFADCRSRRPGFSHAARPELAIPERRARDHPSRHRGALTPLQWRRPGKNRFESYFIHFQRSFAYADQNHSRRPARNQLLRGHR